MVESTECSTAATGGILGLALVVLVNREDEVSIAVSKVSIAVSKVSIAGNDHVIVILQDPQRIEEGEDYPLTLFLLLLLFCKL